MKIMDKLYSSDIFKIFKDFEPSKVKLWEIVRSYNPIEFAKLLYLLENVTLNSKRTIISLRDEYINYNLPENFSDKHLIITDAPSIRLERCAFFNESDDTFWNDGSKTNNQNVKHDDDDDDFEITKLLLFIRSSNIITDDNTNNGHNLIVKNLSDLKFKVLNHNLGTTYYNKMVNYIEYLLLNDNYQNDRNELNNQHENNTSIVTKFMQFYRTMNFKQSIDNDARNFRNIVIPKPVRIFNRDLLSDKRYIVQPLYQGFHVIVYSSPNETKCYNRFGTLYSNFASTVRSKEPCTFEAIILPTDSLNHARCWRYWTFKTGFIMYVVDVFRYKQTILTSTPFKDRIKYINLIIKDQPNMFSAISKMNTWTSIEEMYINRRDLYDPIVGVVLRDPQHIIVNKYKNNVDNNNDDDGDNNFNKRPKAFYFNILYSFDILNTKIVDLNVSFSLDKIRTLHLNYEMADFKIICIAYGHCDEFIYLCTYNRSLHQFVHAATLHRSHMEYTKLTYKPEKIYVINNKTIPRGVLYLRIYFDISKKIIGYEYKHTDDRFQLSYTNPLLDDNIIESVQI